MLGRPQWAQVALTGALQGAITLGVFAWGLRYRDLDEARSLAFSVLVFGEVLRAFASRSDTRTFWEEGALGNVFLLVVGVVSVTLQIAIHHIPFTEDLFHLGYISWADCLLGLAIGLIPVSVLELLKLIRRVRRPAPPSSTVLPLSRPARS